MQLPREGKVWKGDRGGQEGGEIGGGDEDQLTWVPCFAILFTSYVNSRNCCHKATLPSFVAGESIAPTVFSIIIA